MRIPFLSKEIELHQDRVNFIKDYRGGGFMLIGGSVFWILTFILTIIAGKSIASNFYIYGGIIIPLIGYMLTKLLKINPKPSSYSSLVAFSSAITVCCLPIFILIKRLDANYILPVLCIINASHLLILCWIYLDYLYFILTAFGISLGMIFIYSIPFELTHFIGLVWGLLSLIIGIAMHINSKVPLKSYRYTIINKEIGDRNQL